jgi:serine/threonine protein kinase
MDSRVYLATKAATGDIYAIKIMKKEEMVERNQVEHVMAERNILATTSCPYVVSLYYAFQTRVCQCNLALYYVQPVPQL